MVSINNSHLTHKLYSRVSDRRTKNVVFLVAMYLTDRRLRQRHATLTDDTFFESAYDTVAYGPVKTKLSLSQVERKYSEGVRTSIVIGLFSRLCLRLRQSSFPWIISNEVVNRIGRRWKRSDFSDFDSVELMTPLLTPTFDFH